MNIHIAGIENPHGAAAMRRVAPDHVFVSYAKRGVALDRACGNARRCGASLIVDSGAHTFFNQKGGVLSVTNVKRKGTIEVSPSQWFCDYMRWLERNRGRYDYFVELDIGEICGQKTVYAWRRRLARAGLSDRMIVAHHPAVESFDEWLARLDDVESKYVAIEGVRSRSVAPIKYLKYIDVCYERGIRIHGFAMTKIDHMLTYPFYSCDSTSWQSGTRYGRGPVPSMTKPYLMFDFSAFSEQRMRKEVPQKYHSEVLRAGLATSDGSIRRNALGITSMNLAGAMFTRHWARKGYDWNARTATKNPRGRGQPVNRRTVELEGSGQR